MKIVLVGHGMVGHKFLDELRQAQIPGADVTVLCEEPRAAYDRVHLSEFFTGKTAEDLSLVEPGFFENTRLCTASEQPRGCAIDRRKHIR
jgi:nitrite reductase (NADH) large subunit